MRTPVTIKLTSPRVEGAFLYVDVNYLMSIHDKDGGSHLHLKYGVEYDVSETPDKIMDMIKRVEDKHKKEK